MEYYAAEIELNAKFHMFSQNCSSVHAGHNTVQQQLKHSAKNSKRGYIVIKMKIFQIKSVFIY